MQSFKHYLKEEKNLILLEDIEESYFTISNFLDEAAHNIINRAVYAAKSAIAKAMTRKMNDAAKEVIEKHLNNYGGSLESSNNPSPISHLNDEDLFKEREAHIQHLKNLYETDRKAYNAFVSGAQKRLPIEPYGQNKKTATMENEYVDGKLVVDSFSNKGAAGSVTKFGKDGKETNVSTCVNSKQSCRGEGPERMGASCLGMCGNYRQYAPRVAGIVSENMKNMKMNAPNGTIYGYKDKNGNDVLASPHLDYATLEYNHLIKSTELAKKESQESGEHRISIFRQNTANEESAMHYDQLIHNLPASLRRHLATNNYSATIAKGAYDPENPSDKSTHDGKLNNTNFSIKGPEVSFTDKGVAHGQSRSSNLDDAREALTPEVRDGHIIRPAQNAYMVAGGTIDGVRLRQPKSNKKYAIDGKPQLPSFFGSEKPPLFTPYEKLLKLKTARIYGDEITLRDNEPENFQHPDGWGHETHFDPHSGKKRTFEFQDYHVHANVPRPDANDYYDFKKLNDNVGSDERKPKGNQIRRNKAGLQVGSIHIAAPVSAGRNVVADGTVKTDKTGKPVGDEFGLANDPLVFPIQHHIKHDETRIDLNHPLVKFDGEAAEKRNRSQRVDFVTMDAPATKQEKGELK